MALRSAIKAGICLLASVVLLTLAAPVALYFYGLSLVDPLPSPPQLATREQQLLGWRAAERSETVMVDRLTPWSPWLAFGGVAVRSHAAGEALYPGYRASSFVAGRHVVTHGGQLRQLDRHLATAAVAVWLTRHWSAEEIASGVFELEAEASANRASRNRPWPSD